MQLVVTKQRLQSNKDVKSFYFGSAKNSYMTILFWRSSYRKKIDCETIVFQCHSKKLPGTSVSLSNFKSSRSWFKKFKRHTDILYVNRHSGSMSSNKSGVKKFVSPFGKKKKNAKKDVSRTGRKDTAKI